MKDLKILTPRENDVHKLICGGFTNDQIEQRLGLSDVTVRNLVHVVLRKKGLARTAAAVSAFRSGQYDPKTIEVPDGV